MMHAHIYIYIFAIYVYIYTHLIYIDTRSIYRAYSILCHLILGWRRRLRKRRRQRDDLVPPRRKLSVLLDQRAGVAAQVAERVTARVAFDA